MINFPLFSLYSLNPKCARGITGRQLSLELLFFVLNFRFNLPPFLLSDVFHPFSPVFGPFLNLNFSMFGFGSSWLFILVFPLSVKHIFEQLLGLHIQKRFLKPLNFLGLYDGTHFLPRRLCFDHYGILLRLINNQILPKNHPFFFQRLLVLMLLRENLIR